MTQLMSDSDVAKARWTARMQSLPAAEQADMLAGVFQLLRRPDAISTPLEAELQVLAEQVYLSLGRHLLAQ